MLSNLEDLANSIGVTPELLFIAGIGVGVLVLIFGLAGAFSGPTEEVRRMRAAASRGGYSSGNAGVDLVRSYERRPEGFLKAFVPSSEEERTKIAKKLRQAGFHTRNAIRDFYAIRTLLAVSLPLLFLGLFLVPPNVPFISDLRESASRVGTIGTFQILTGLVLLGFYGPSIWLWNKIRIRRREIEFGFPNALDLLQVAIEAGLGFDAAMSRVANELARVSAPIAEELMMLQLEIQAGKDRERAFLDMAARTGVDEVAAFANVILQSTQFGTSVSEALSVYASEMRINRELKAQERANKLPVQMSGIMAGFMMPVLLMLILTPVLIRWTRSMSDEG